MAKRSASRGALEKELKYYLDRKSYYRLLKVLRSRIIKQDKLVTYYFDDRKLGLRKKRFGFRVRTNGGTGAKLTLKFPAKTAEKGPLGFKVRHEFEEEIPMPVAKGLLKGRVRVPEVDAAPVRVLRRHFSRGFLKKLRVLGSLKTKRTLARLGRFELEIDRCETFGKNFYELELETSRPGAGDKAIRAMLEKHDIPYIPMLQSKLSRFLEEWEKHRK